MQELVKWKWYYMPLATIVTGFGGNVAFIISEPA
jgi:hypothetical protein